MPRALVPPRGIFFPSVILYNNDLPAALKLTWITLRGLAWGSNSSPPLRFEDLERITRKSRTALYRHLTLLKQVNALSWTTTGGGKLLLIFPEDEAIYLEHAQIPPDNETPGDQAMTDDIKPSLEDDPGVGVESPVLENWPDSPTVPQMDTDPGAGEAAQAFEPGEQERNLETDLGWDDPILGTINETVPAETLELEEQDPNFGTDGEWDDRSSRPKIETEHVEVLEADGQDPKFGTDVGQVEKKLEIGRVKSQNWDSLKLINQDQKNRIINPVLLNYLESKKIRTDLNIKNIKELFCSDSNLVNTEAERREPGQNNPGAVHGGDGMRGESGDEPSNPPALNTDSLSGPEAVYTELTRLIPSEAHQARMTQRVTDLAVWRDSIEHWLNHGWNPKNVAGMLEIYKRGGGLGCFICAHAER